MGLTRRVYARTSELTRGQTMTEYPLSLAAVALMVFDGYQTIGHYNQQAAHVS